VKGYISIELEKELLSIGYSYSDFDIYNGRRNLVIEGISINEMLWRKRPTHTFFVAIAYRF
jgi:hypothetical protein